MVFHFTLKDGSIGSVDEKDKDKIGERTWYVRNGHVTASVDGKRTKLVWLLGKKGFVVYRNGNIRDCQRSNLLSHNRKEEANYLLPKEEWLDLVSQFGEGDVDVQTNIIDYLWDRTRTTPFPRYKYQQEKLLVDFYTLLHCEEQGIINRSCGGALSRMFCADAILSCRKGRFATADEVWNDKTHFTRLIKSMIRLKTTAFNINRINTTFACCFYKASNFPSLVARNLYDHVFLPRKKNKRVLDPCSGYGGRLTGFWASKTCKSYVGIDPNLQLVLPYKNLVGWFKEHTNIDKSVQMIQSCAEDFEYDVLNPVDIIFTSPPYFDLEKYGTDDTQSYIRYPNIEKWTHSFLLTMIEKSVTSLKRGGILAINVRPHPTWKYPVIEKMREKVEGMGFYLQETLFLPLHSRPNAKTKVSQEPIFVFAYT